MAFRNIVCETPESIAPENMEKDPIGNLYWAYMNNKIHFGKSGELGKKQVEEKLKKHGYSIEKSV